MPQFAQHGAAQPDPAQPYPAQSPAQPAVVRLIMMAMVSVAVVVIGIGTWLWLSAQDGSVPVTSIGLWAFGAAELVAAALLGRVLMRRIGVSAGGSAGYDSTAGYDGTAATYQDGDVPPGMVQ